MGAIHKKFERSPKAILRKLMKDAMQYLVQMNPDVWQEILGIHNGSPTHRESPGFLLTLNQSAPRYRTLEILKKILTAAGFVWCFVRI
jgi:hypothetical protein